MRPFLSHNFGAQGAPKVLTTHPRADTLWMQGKLGHFCSPSTLFSSFAFECNCQLNSKVQESSFLS